MRAALLTCVVAASPALAAPELIFGTGKPPVYKEEDVDARFAKSKVARALRESTQDPHCASLLRGLLASLAEVAPFFHKRDDSYFVEPAVLEALGSQLSSPRFNGPAYLTAMVRRVMLDRRLPEEWLATAQALQPEVGPVDIGKLKMLADGLRPIDSFMLTLPQLIEQYDIEVRRATGAVSVDPYQQFRDNYLDRDIAWPALTLLEAGYLRKNGTTAKRKRSDGEELTALLSWSPARKEDDLGAGFLPRKKAPVFTVVAKLQPKQYANIERMPKGMRVLVRGRLWDVSKTADRFFVSDALLFFDRDFSQGALLGDAQATAACPFAVTELMGVGPTQPRGYRH